MILEKHVNFQNIKIIKDFSNDLPEIQVDINQFKSVINNLALNAADAMPDGGKLQIKTKYDKNHEEIILTIADTGSGISEEYITKIFDPFFTTKETGKGTGLGLSVTYGIIQRHNGTIDVQSDIGKGTTFTIKMPVSNIDSSIKGGYNE